MKKIIALSFILCFALVACKSKKETVKKQDRKVEQKAEAKPIADPKVEEAYDPNQMPSESDGDLFAKRALAKLSDSLVARIQTTACFGRCPIYTASIYKSGYVKYVGEKWVEKEGIYSSRISQEKVDALLNEAKKINFQSLDNVYDSKGVTDLPSTIITLRFEEGPKIVVNRYQGPESLYDFQLYFDEVLNQLSYEKIQLD